VGEGGKGGGAVWLSLFLCPSFCLSIFLSISPFFSFRLSCLLSMSLYLFLFLSLSLSLSFSFFSLAVSLFPFRFLSYSLSFSFSVSFTLCLSLSMSHCLSLSLSRFLVLSLFFCLSFTPASLLKPTKDLKVILKLLKACLLMIQARSSPRDIFDIIQKIQGRKHQSLGLEIVCSSNTLSDLSRKGHVTTNPFPDVSRKCM
jgi:hypothetical protein